MNIFAMIVIFFVVIAISIVFGKNSVFGKPKPDDDVGDLTLFPVTSTDDFFPMQFGKDITGCHNCHFGSVAVFNGMRDDPGYGNFCFDCTHPKNKDKDVSSTGNVLKVNVIPTDCPIMKN